MSIYVFLNKRSPFSHGGIFEEQERSEEVKIYDITDIVKGAIKIVYFSLTTLTQYLTETSLRKFIK